MELDKQYFTHLVLFWLKDSSDKGKLIDGLKRLVNTSNYAHNGHIGTPAPTHRAVVESSYDVSLFVTFASQEDHDSYQTESAHLEFIESCKPLWQKVQICDALRVQ